MQDLSNFIEISVTNSDAIDAELKAEARKAGDYETLFPLASFNDKIMVVYADGSEETFKHLYLSTCELDDVDWTKVVECWEC